MQAQDSCDLHLCIMKVKLEIPSKQQQTMGMAPSRSLPRSVSELADPPSPFSSNPSHHQAVSTPTTPAASSSSSFGCMTSRPTTDSPPSTPTRSKPSTPTGAASAFQDSYWSPKRLMQRAARAFSRSSGRSRRLKTFRDAAAAATGDDRAPSSSPTGRGGSKVSAASAAVLPVGSAPAPATDADIAAGDAHGGAAVDIIVRQQEDEHRHDHQDPEAVPEKIIHEMKRHAPAVVAGDDEFGAAKTTTTPSEEKETAAEEEVESPKKAVAALAPEAETEVVPGVGGGEEVADKFVTVVKEAIRKHEEEHKGGDQKKGVAAEAGARKFQSRVKTAMEARAESEQPRRREPGPRSNDVIEEARSMLLEKRQCSRVRALVGAFETVMDTNTKDAAAGTPRTPATAGTPRSAAASGLTPRHSYRSSA
ncbi:unnamed protein product [Urochloa humidicola]